MDWGDVRRGDGTELGGDLQPTVAAAFSGEVWGLQIRGDGNMQRPGERGRSKSRARRATRDYAGSLCSRNRVCSCIQAIMAIQMAFRRRIIF
jgi:hypothetical protein